MISTTEAKTDKLFYIVANIIIINSADGTCLLLKRSETEKVLGGKWAFPGGKLEHKDVESLLTESGKKPIEGVDNILADLAAREAHEECGLVVDGIKGSIIKNKVFVRPDGVPVFMVTLTAEYSGGTVVLEDGAFSDYAWANLETLENYDCIDGIHDEARIALS